MLAKEMHRARKECTIRLAVVVVIVVISLIRRFVANAQRSSTYRMAQVFVHNASDNNHWVQFKHFVHIFFSSRCRFFFRSLPTLLHFAIYLRSFVLFIILILCFMNVITVHHVSQCF